MANQVSLSTTFDQWRLITNQIILEIGSITTLTTTNKTSLVNSIIEINNTVTNLRSNIGDITKLDTTSKVSLVLAMNEVVSNITNISTQNTTINNKLGNLTTLTTTIKSSLVESINELNTNKANKTSLNFPNLDLNNGRFASEKGITATTIHDGILKSFNSSVFTTVDKFIDDNSTNGGAGATLPSKIVSLMTKLVAAGRTDQRYGYEFFILNIKAGAGTQNGVMVDGINYYPILTTDRYRLGRIGSKITWQGWMNVSSLGKRVIVGDTTTTVYVNGVKQSSLHPVTDTDGWVFIKLVKTLTNEYENHLPSIRAIDGTMVHLALTGIFEGEGDIPTHLSIV